MTDMVQTIPLEDMHRRDNARALEPGHVAELTGSMKALGFKASEPITLRQDGDIYWITDGGHRHAAALAAGLTEAPAVIEDVDDAGMLALEGALNIQRPDTDEEKWARLQGFLPLGKAAKPELVQVATGIDSETWQQVKKARKVLGDDTAFEDMTLDDMPVILALENDKDALAEYLKVPVQQRKYRGLRILDDIALAEKAAAFRAECEAAGVTILAHSQLGGIEGYTYIKATGPSIEARPEGAVAATVNNYGGGTLHVRWYAEATGEETEAQKVEAAKQEAEAAHRAALEAAHEARIAFIAANIDTGKELKKVAVAAWESGKKLPEAFSDLTGTYSRMLAYELLQVDATTTTALRNPTDNWYRKEYGPKATALLKALVADGYEMSDVEAEALKALAPAKKPKAKKEAAE